MAKRVNFGTSKPKPKSDPTDFNFGFNALSSRGKKAYRKQIRKGGHGGGGS